MNSLNGVVNLALLGVLLYRPNRLRTVMVFNLVWVLLQFVWIAVRPQDWLLHMKGVNLTNEWKHYLLIQFIDPSYLYRDILCFFCFSIVVTALNTTTQEAKEVVEEEEKVEKEDSFWKAVRLPFLLPRRSATSASSSSTNSSSSFCSSSLSPRPLSSPSSTSPSLSSFSTPPPPALKPAFSPPSLVSYSST